MTPPSKPDPYLEAIRLPPAGASHEYLKNYIRACERFQERNAWRWWSNPNRALYPLNEAMGLSVAAVAEDRVYCAEVLRACYEVLGDDAEWFLANCEENTRGKNARGQRTREEPATAVDRMKRSKMRALMRRWEQDT